ncbi:MAG: hypothetical protein RL417_2460 [Pseudomonadota bacterium]|jgi:hypothetical protein
MAEIILTNLTSPMILAFALGVIAVVIRSDLKFPDALYTSLSMVLLLAIGLKGGVAIRESGIETVFVPLIVTLGLGILTPLVAYNFARRVTRLSRADGAALAAHYGSVSVVTFIASLSFLERLGRPAEPFMSALVAALEIPAILIALLLYKAREGKGVALSKVFHEIVAGKSIVLLVGGVLIGFTTGKAGFAKIAPLFEGLFPGLLVLFLLEIGLVCGSRLKDLRTAGVAIGIFGVVVPLINSLLGAVAGALAGLSLEGSFVLATMAASASYIAAPAAVRIALPEANPGYYVTASLAVTFPFNLSLGIPLYYSLTAFIFRYV